MENVSNMPVSGGGVSGSDGQEGEKNLSSLSG